MKLDHERLDVYQTSLDLAVWSYKLAKRLKSADRHSRDQLLRASQSIALNIAEGCGKLVTRTATLPPDSRWLGTMLTRMVGQLSDYVRETETVYEYAYGRAERPNEPLGDET